MSGTGDVATSQPPPLSRPSTPTGGLVQHVGIFCDGESCKAGRPTILDWSIAKIEGPRFKCIACQNADFCTACEPKHDDKHPRLMLRTPLPRTVSRSLSTMVPTVWEVANADSELDSLDDDLVNTTLNEISAESDVPTPDTQDVPTDVSGGVSGDEVGYHTQHMKEIESRCDADEKLLLDSVVDLSNVPDDYSHVHFRPDVIEMLESALAKSGNRADQFEYGVLKGSRVTGGMLYGPPGTGKTVFAQAVAKKCQFNMLCITPANIFGSLWGHDENAIRAAFRLARKLHPCLMFVDEADGILGRRQDDERKHVRTMLAEFLREWDGATDERTKQQNPFVLLATNRPWDVDPAAARRAPVQILLDVPTLDERKGILTVILMEETLGADVNLDLLARQTRSFSGSDLRMLCVCAALRCLHDQKPDAEGAYETKRVLERRHFDVALGYIKPSALDRTMARKLAEFQRNGTGPNTR